MSLSLDLAAALKPMIGQTFQPARNVSVSDGQGMTLSLDLLNVESLGVACDQVHLNAPALSAASIDVLKTWASGLCQRITYLLETLNPLEFDVQNQQVLIRSNPPDTTTTGQPRYYEVLLTSQGGGKFTLQRYEANPGGRAVVPLRLTHEQLAKLVNDLLATLPNP